MADDSDNVCVACKGTTFYTESGFYFCTQCQTQKEDVNEQINDAQFDTTTRTRTMKIQVEKKTEKDIIGWTSWELYNFVLLGMTNELIEIGVDPDIKMTILQLWTYYLSKLEVAFTSKNKKCIPKMARRYHKKDAEIIYGKIQKSKKRKRSRSSKSSKKSASLVSTSIASSGNASRKDFIRSQRKAIEMHNELAKSQLSSDGDANSSMNQSLQSLQSSFIKDSSNNVRLGFNKRAKLEAKRAKEKSENVPRAKKVFYKTKYVSNQYATGPDVLTPLKIWSIIYLALRIHNQKIYLSDMLRFSRENHLTYYKLDNLIPSEVTLTKNDVNFLTQTTDISHKSLRRTAARMAHFLNVTVLPKPNIIDLIKRYCEDLELPRGIMLYAQRFYLSFPSTMDYTIKSSLIPNYEGRAMAYIIVVLKILFGLDDITEKDISRIVDKINRAAEERNISTEKLFNFCQWQQFIECRKSILASIHFPSKIKYDPENTNKSHLYLRFIGLLKSNHSYQEKEKGKHVISHTLTSTMDQCIDKLNDNDIPLKEMVTFPPSLIPLKFYISQLDENSHVDIPYVLQTKFYNTKVGYMTKPDSLIELATDCEISLKVVDKSVHYLEKIVPAFEQAKLPEANELKELVKVETLKSSQHHIKKQTNNLLDYTFRKRACKLKINPEGFHYYSTVCNKKLDLEETLDFEEDSFFDQVLPDGRLNIENDSDSEHENVLDKIVSDHNTFKLDEEFFKKQKIELYNHELESLNNLKKTKIVKNVLYRDSRGKFAKSTDKNIKKEYKKIAFPLDRSSDEEIESISKSKPKIKRKTKKVPNFNQSKITKETNFVELSESDISILDEDVTIVNETKPTIKDDEILFRPYKDYWMYHCNFSLVKGKNFKLVEKELPENFLWLLNECADMIEMQNEDLYEEVCLIEAYHLNVLQTNKSKNHEDYQFHDCDSKAYKNNVKNKW